MKRIVILGGGTAGTLMANKLARALPQGWSITVIDRDDVHIYQPGLLFLPFGQERVENLKRARTVLFDSRVELRLQEIENVDANAKTVSLADGTTLNFEILIVATGSRIRPDLTPGLMAEGWRKSAFDFYTLEGAQALGDALERFEGGRLVLNVAEMPIKCPVAPLEFLFLADAYFAERGLRHKIELIYTTPLEGAFTKPKASAAFGNMLSRRNIEVVGDFSLESVDGEQRVITSYDGRKVNYDLLVSIPIHGGAEAISKSNLGDASGWVPTDRHTLQSTLFPYVFALGDATDLPASKAGSVAHFQGEVLFENVQRFIAGKPLLPQFDGHANCFIETGHGKAMLIDFNYDTEPLPGRFPLPGIGPFTLLEESAVNHWGKVAFKWVYWNALLAGTELPIDHRMVMAGKYTAAREVRP